MPKTKVEVYNKDQLIYPFIESDHVTFSNGMKVSEMLDQSISMPTVTHEDLSFKVGVGDQDVSSAIVDSSVSEMTIKGKTYQNILPEPSTHVLTNNKEMFKVNEGLDPNVEIVDGVSKSAILKGNTLVNIYKITQSTPYTYGNGSYPMSKLTVNLLANKTYLILLDFSTVDKDGKEVINFFPMSTFTDGKTKQESNFNIKQSGKFTYKYTPTKDVKEYGIIIGQNNFATNNPTVVLETAMIIEYQQGMENWNIPYFEGIQSVKMPILTTIGKNLFDFGKTQTGYLGANPHGLNAPDYNNKTSDYIKVKPNTSYTYSFDGFTASQVGGTYWTGWYYYTSPTEVSKKDMNRHVASGSADTFKTVTFTTPSDCYYVRIGSRGLALSGAVAQLEEGSVATTYEPYKTNILYTPEDVVLKGVGGVKDTLNCNTGEMVERIGEIVYTGNENWKTTTMDQIPDNIGFYLPLNNHLNDTNNTTMRGLVKDNLGFTNNCFSATINTPKLNGKKGFSIHNNGNVYFTIPTSECANVNDWKNKLKEQPLVLQYAINPTVKTVDLSSSGNWEKVVLNGSENWGVTSESSKYNAFFRGSNIVPNNVKVNSNNLAQKVICDILTPFTQDQICNKPKDNYGISLGWNDSDLCVRHKDFPLTNEGLIQWKQYLSQNPITVWYQTTNHKDSTQVKQPIFFKDGHIIQSSGADHSLIPTLDYQAKTSNSYVMDLMKANTRYTMKAKTASGTFTIDGTSYGAGTNGTFTTPSSMTNKFLVMSNKTNEEVMIIEGDVVSKTIPYFKGIKSAFEGESKIEVLSTGKNLFDGAFEKGVIDASGNLGYSPSAIRTVNYISVKPNTSYHINLLNLEPFESLRVVYVHEYDENFKVLGEKQVDNRNIYTSKSATKFIKINTHTAHDLPVDSKMIVCENSTLDKQYEPYKSNSTKIPLLSPLRSLPNGVYDELIIDRMKKKTTLIQRIKSTVFNGSENWNLNGYSHDKLVEFVCHSGTQLAHAVLSDRFATGGEDVERVAFASGSIYIRILKTKASNVDSFKKWLSQNPLTVQCGLQTPLTTEVDLEGFPYIYKDGHIFLNSKIVPTTEIIYSINQCQQISASNEDIIRHEKELTYLQKLIAQYVQVDYESALLSLKV